MKPTRHLDRAIELLRSPSKPVSSENQMQAYAQGLRALGWQQRAVRSNHLVFTKGTRTAHVYEQAIWMRFTEAAPFKPLPPKARRNIALAGVANEA